MVYSLVNDLLVESSIDAVEKKEGNFLCIFTFKELEAVKDKIVINNEIFLQSMIGRTSKFGSYEGFDFISLIIPDLKNPVEVTKVAVFINKTTIIFVCDTDRYIVNKINDLICGTKKCTSIYRSLYLFIDRLTDQDTYDLEKIEQEISNLEDGIIDNKTEQYLHKILSIRKKLLKLKRYYEQFSSVLEEMEGNENEIFDKKIMKSFKIVKSRITRLYQSVINLKDYVSQVREAYDAQIDINQNRLMKIFTVITTIFLPLTLVVGWYGMNVKMPEYDWAYGYLYVIIISIVLVLVSIYIIRKKKWF